MKPYNFVEADSLEGHNKRLPVAEDSLRSKWYLIRTP